MRRPKALRRLRARVFDRRLAAGAFSLAAVVVLVAVGVARTPAPAPEVDRRDPRAARDLVALMRMGERGSWLARYDFTRTLADGRALHQAMSEARRPSMHVLLSDSAMTVERGGRVYDCTLVDDRSSCTASRTGKVLPASEVLRVAVAVGAYGVSRRPSVSIAGEQARCFRVLASGRGQLTDIGAETDTCLSVDGVPLSQRVLRSSGDVDERVARSVDPRVTTRTIEALEQSFGPGAALGQP